MYQFLGLLYGAMIDLVASDIVQGDESDALLEFSISQQILAGFGLVDDNIVQLQTGIAPR